jgi:hypothetical protein
MIHEKYYRERGGLLHLIPKKGAKGTTPAIYSEAEFAAISSLELLYGGTYYNETSYTGLFDWSTYASTGKIEIDMSILKDTIPAGEDVLTTLLAYSTDFPDGIVIGQFLLTVSDEAEL